MRLTRIVALLALAAVGLLPAQSRIVVFEFQPVSVDSNVAPVVATLLRDRLTDTKVFTVVTTPPGAVCFTVEAADSVARLVNAEKALIGSITSLGSKRLISYKMIDVATGTVALSDRTTVGDESELDAVTERIATALKSGSTYAGTGTPGNLTEREKVVPTSRQPFGTILFTTGYTFPLSHRFPYDPGNMLFTLDAAITYETPGALAMGEMGLMRGKFGFTGVHFDLLAHKVFAGKDVAPFLGGGLGVHRLSFTPGYESSLPAKDDDGLELVASGGVLLFRSYYFRIIGDLRGSVLLTQEFGTIASTGLHFGLTSPGTNEGEVRTPPGLLYVTLVGMFVTGLVVALNH